MNIRPCDADGEIISCGHCRFWNECPGNCRYGWCVVDECFYEESDYTCNDYEKKDC